MTVMLVRSIEHAKLIRMGEECAQLFVNWYDVVSEFELLVEDMMDLEDEGNIAASRTAALRSAAVYAESMEAWFDYLNAREAFMELAGSVSGAYDKERD